MHRCGPGTFVAWRSCSVRACRGGLRAWYRPGGMKIEILMSPGCGHGARALDLVRDVVGLIAPGVLVEPVVVATPERAAQCAFPGSPTVRVDGVDVDPEAPTSVGFG